MRAAEALQRAGFLFCLICGYGAAASAESLQLQLPIACEPGRSCFIQNYLDADPSPSAKDYACGSLTYDKHNGTDFRLPSMVAQRAGVNVLAAAEGRVARVRDGVPDVSIRENGKEAVSGMECGNGVAIEHPDGWETQYCHMAQGSLQVKSGDSVKAGQVVGRVGISGLTEFPHLHFTLRHQGKVVDPFAYEASAGSCGEGQSLWAPSLRERLAYKDRSVLNAGFTTGAVTMESIESGEAEKAEPSTDAPALVVFIRAIGLRAGDVQLLTMKNPAGQIIAENRTQPLDRDKAQVMLFAGRKRASGGWEHGAYKATYVVERDGQAVLERQLEFSFK